MPTLAHRSFIRSRLPAWLLDASPAEQTNLRQASLSLASAGYRLNDAIKAIPSIRDFALPRLQPAMDRLFGGSIDLDSSSLISPDGHDRHSLFDWALYNFTQADTQETALEGSRLELFPDSDRAASSTPDEFAKRCRELDIGAAYQTELEHRIPAWPDKVADVPPLAIKYLEYHQALLQHDAQQARMQGLLDADGERILANFRIQLDAARPVDALATAVVSGLQLNHKQGADQPAGLRGVRVYWARNPATDKGKVSLVVHIPGDPVAPLKQYAGSFEFARELFARLTRTGDAAFLRSLVPLRDRGGFDKVVQYKGRDEQRDIIAAKVADGYFHGLYQEWRSSVMARSSEVARPVALIDRKALPDNSGWLNLGMEVAALIALCVAGAEVVEAAVVVIGIGQLIRDVYEGIQELSEGHLRQAIGHLFEAALDAGLEATGDFAANKLVGEMFPVPLVNDSLRLWHGLTEGFIAKRSPPVGLAPDEFGIWRAAGRAWVKVGEHFYEVVGDERSLRLKLPANHQGLEPALEWSRARGWRWAYQSPLCMEGFRLLREVVPEFRSLRDISLQRAQWVTGITDEQLRYAALNDEPLPGQLLYMARRFEAREQFLEAEVRLRAGEALSSVPLGMVQLLTELPGWPTLRAFRYTGEAGTAILSQGTGTELLLDVADFSAGRWQERLLAQLESAEVDALLGVGASSQAPAILFQRLADRLADRLKTNGFSLIDAFADLDAFSHPDSRPGAALMHRLFPSLPGPMLDSLLASVTGEELQGLLADQVTNSLARRTVEALRELRICRALEFMLASEASNDRDRLVMAMLGPELHYMDELVRVQLILGKGSAGEPLRLGKRGPIMTIRRSGGDYQLFDEAGKELTPPTSLEVTLSRILFKNQPNAMDLAVQGQGDLRARLFERALKSSRASLRFNLGMLALKPPKLRLLGGYPMIDRSSLVSAHRPLDERLWRLYPNRGISAAVKTELQARSSTSGRAIELLVNDKETEWNQLDLSLRNWETATVKHHDVEHDNPAVRLEARQHFGQELRMCWRRERTSTVIEEGAEREAFSLAVGGDIVGVLPSLNADFSHVELLMLRDMGLTPDPSHFLRLFPRVTALWLSENHLTHCPPAVAQMPRLRLLHLDRNPVVFDEQMFAPLLAAGADSEFQLMDLSGINTAMGAVGPGGVSAIEALGRLPRLEELIWLDNDGFTPQQLQAIGRLTRLKLLDLTNCRLRLDAQSAAFVARLSGLQRLNLGGNIISELPILTGLSRLIDLDLSRARIERVPLAVIELLRRQPLGLLAIDLSGNRITDVEALSLALARPLGEGERVVVALDDNPLSTGQIERLRGTGQSFAYGRDIWMGNETVQRRFEALRQNPADGQFLDWLSDAVEQSERYDFGPDLDSGRDRALALAGTFFQLDAETAQLAVLVPALNERFAAFRKRIYQRLQHLPLPILDERTPPILDELETHLAIFLRWCRAIAQPQQPPFASFIQDLHAAWLEHLSDVQGWSNARIASDATQERFVQRLLETQGAYSQWENPQYGDLYWFPYLEQMSARWAGFQTEWDTLGETLTEASSAPVDTSNWPQVLRDNLAAPVALPGPALEATADVDWGNTAVQLNEDQYRRAWAIFRAVKASEAERVAIEATEELVGPWWAGGGRLGAAP